MDLAKKMDLLVSLCKRRGFVYADSDIYGGFANAWDYGPYGIELKNNIRDAWWQMFVRERDDVVGVDTPVIQHPKIWEASGHLSGFSDPLVEDKKTHKRYRLDHLLEAAGADISGFTFEQMSAKMAELKLKSPDGNELSEPKQFNLMFQTSVGVSTDTSSVAYLRPETAAGMFTTWRDIRDTMRKKLPFGIAQVGRAFRNEITPGNFIFRTREFEQMEIEYFVKGSDADQAFEAWLDAQKTWVHDVLKLDPSRVVYKEIPEADRAFYSSRSVDTEYLYPFGQKELYGLANRTTHDLSRHQEFSGEDLRWIDQETGERYIPYVIEPTWGLSRTVLAVLCEHLDIDEADTTAEGQTEPRMVLRLPVKLAPVKVAVFPLTKKEGQPEIAKDLVKQLRKRGWMVEYDESGSIGKRYRRQDEIGTPWCVTIDFDTVNEKTVTVRDRDSMEQVKVPLADIPNWIAERLA